MKPSSRVLKAVDPDLKIVSGNIKKRKAPPPSNHRRLTVEDWERADGSECPRCGNHSLRFINGFCPQCASEISEAYAKKAESQAMIREMRRQIKTTGKVDGSLIKTI